MMSIEAEAPTGEARVGAVASLVAKLKGMLADRSDSAVAKRFASGAFLIRVVNAGIAFVSQILLARWMGESQYGVYVYVWTWVLLLGGSTSLGLAMSPQRFIPQYTQANELGLLRGFLVGSRLLAIASSTVFASVGLLGVWLFSSHLDHWAVVPLYLAFFCVPMYVLTDVQDGIARSYNWIDVALAPAYFVRPMLILLVLGALSLQHFPATATTAMAGTIVATWAAAVAQLVTLEIRLRKKLPAGPKTYAPATWMKVSLPLFMVDGFYLMLAYTDILVLSAFREPHEVGIYYAAVKVMSLVAFVSFSVSAAVSHRFTEYSVSGDHHRLSKMVRDAARWTFWPSLAGASLLLLVGWPILWLFGKNFTEGYPLLFIIALGLVTRATIGPLERLLNMLGKQKLCAVISSGCFALNLVLCLSLVPVFGMAGAAASTSATLIFESIVLYRVTRRRLGLGALPWARAAAAAPTNRETTGDAVADMVALSFSPVDPATIAAEDGAASRRFELVSPQELAAHPGAWDDLRERSLERNPFSEADFGLAASRLDSVKGVRLATIWDDSGEAPRLIAVAPVTSRRILPLISTLASTQWAFFGALGTPMIDRDHADAAIEALFKSLSARGDLLFQFRYLPENGPTADAIRRVAQASGLSIVRVDGHERAVLRKGPESAAYLATSLSSKKLKELRRQLRRLGDGATVSFEEARTPEEVAAALERFLVLETEGWKGDRGSAMLNHADQTAFIRELFRRSAEKGNARILELMVGDAPVASGLVLTSGREGWFYKIAYDERHARCSPGVQLTIELTKRLLDDPEIDVIDSTAIPNHPMIDHVWRERLAIGDWFVSTRRGASPLIATFAKIERARGRARAKARDLYYRVKDGKR